MKSSFISPRQTGRETEMNECIDSKHKQPFSQEVRQALLFSPVFPLSFGQKRHFWGTKICPKKIWVFLSKGRLNLRANQKTDCQNHVPSELQELEVRICVQLNFPIVTLILLNGFHKFQWSRGLNSGDQCGEDVPQRHGFFFRTRQLSHIWVEPHNRWRLSVTGPLFALICYLRFIAVKSCSIPITGM